MDAVDKDVQRVEAPAQSGASACLGGFIWQPTVRSMGVDQADFGPLLGGR